MKRIFSEARLLRLKLESGENSDFMEPLKGMQRTKESTIGAAQNVFGGARGMMTGKNGRLRSSLRFGQGIVDAADIVTSLPVDGIRSLSGMPTGNARPGRYNITRAALDYKNIRVDDPVNTIKDTVAYTTGLFQAVLFKPVSDGLKAAQNFSKN